MQSGSVCEVTLGLGKVLLADLMELVSTVSGKSMALHGLASHWATWTHSAHDMRHIVALHSVVLCGMDSQSVLNHPHPFAHRFF